VATLDPLDLTARVERADVALAQSLFEGAEGGYLTGTVRADEAGVAADLELHEGEVSVVGLDMEGVEGPVRFRDGKLTTNLTGRALGGPVQGTATVDLAAQRWRADVTGDAALREAAAWLGPESLPLDALDLTGRADMDLTLSGWQDVTLTGAAAGRGSLRGEPLRDLQVDFGFETGVGTRAEGSGRLGGAPFSFALTPQGEGFTVRAQGEDLPLAEGFVADLGATLEGGDGGLTGTTNLQLQGQAAGRQLTLDANATTEGEGWTVDLSGEDDRGGRASGQVRLQEGTVRGEVNLDGLSLPNLSGPVDATLRADGPLERLPLELSLDDVQPEVGGVRTQEDLSGTVRGTLRGTQLEGLSGQLGPLSLEGSLDLAAREGRLSYDLAPTPLAGRAAGRVGAREGRLTLEDGELRTQARLQTEGVRGAGVGLPDLNAAVSVGGGEALSASVRDPEAGLDVSLQEGTLTGTLKDTPVDALGAQFTLNGEVEGRTEALLDTLIFDLQAQAPETTLSLQGDAENAQVSLNSEAGATLAGRTLQEPLDLSGEASLRERQAALSGTLGALGLEVNARRDASGDLETTAGLRSGGENFRAEFRSPASWETEGTLPLAELSDALGLPLRGTLRTDLRREGGRYAGTARLHGEVAGLPVAARAQGTGEAVTVWAEAAPGGRKVTLSGPVLPEAQAELQVRGLGALELTGPPSDLSVSGGGRLPRVAGAGLEVPAQPWRVQGNLAAGRVRVEVGESVLNVVREDGWNVRGTLDQSARYRDLPLRLRAQVARTAANPGGRVDGTLRVGPGALELSGSLRDLALTGAVPVGALQPGLEGRLELDAQADLLTQSYDLTGVWRDGEPKLRLQAQGQRGELRATATAPGLEAALDTQGETPTWRVNAEDYALASLLETPVLEGATLDGALRAGEDYEGALALRTDSGTVRLRGAGDALRVQAQLARGPLRVSAAGRVAPTLQVALQAAVRDALRLDGTLQGTPTAPVLSAQVETAAQSFAGGQVTLPARSAALRASLGDGLELTLQGDGLDLALADGTWGGDLDLPFTLRGEPHALRAALAGPLANPDLSGALQGALVSGPLRVSRAGAQASLELTPALEALPDARLEADLRADPDLTWSAAVQGSATLPARQAPAALQATLSGEGATYRGEGVLSVSGERVPLRLSGTGGNFEAGAQLDGFNLSSLTPAQGTLSGSVRATTAPGELRYLAELDAAGELFGRTFDLALLADSASGVGVSGAVGGAALELSGTPEALGLTLADAVAPFDLTAQVSLGETFTLQGAGSYRGEPLSVRGTLKPETLRGEARAALGDATLRASVQPEGDGRALSARLRAPSGLLSFEEPLSADLRVLQGAGALRVERLDARIGENALELSGAVQPQADLAGTLSVPAAGAPTALRLTSLETGYLASLTQEALQLRGVLSPSLKPQRVRLEGTLARPRLDLESDLVWQEGAGFLGEAALRLSPTESAQATLALAGGEAGGLELDGSALYKERALAALDVALSPAPWRDGRLAGRLTLDAPLGDLIPGWVGDPLALTGALELGGELRDPRLSGPLGLTGALTASGRLTADPQGARLELRGPDLTTTATVDAQGYRATVSADGLDLGGVLPSAQRPRLSGVLRAAQAWGEAPSAQLTDLRLRTPGSRLTGHARYRGDLFAAFELDARLADLGRGLRGRVVGPVVIGSVVDGGTPLSGTLRLENLGRAGADWGLGGTLTLAGSLRDPQLGARLAGRGSASGTLSAELSPRVGEVGLESDLAVVGLETDLELSRTPDGLAAAGTLAYGPYGAALSALEGTLVLAGQGELAGWRARVDPAEGAASLRGALESLNPQLGGELALRAAWRGPRQSAWFGGDWLTGELRALEVGPVRVGDVRLGSAGARRVALSGERLQASVGLSGALDWRLARLELPLPGGLRLRAQGSGTRQAGALTGRLARTDLALPFEARYAEGDLGLVAQGELASGRVDLRARYGSAWTGGLTFRGPAGTFQSTLSGELTQPRVEGTVDLEQGAASLRGAFAASREALTVEGRVTVPAVEEPLELEGSGWPLELRVATPESPGLRLTLRDGALRGDGALTLTAGPARVRLSGGEDALGLLATAPAAPGLALRGRLPADLGAWSALDGFELRGVERTEGEVVLRAQGAPSATFRGFRWEAPAGALSLSGEASLAGGTLRGRWQGEAPSETPLPWIGGLELPFTLVTAGEEVSLRSESDLGTLEAHLNRETQAITLGSDLKLGAGRAQVDARYTPQAGPQGTVNMEGLPFRLRGVPAALTTHLNLDARGLGGDGTLRLGGGRFDLTGQLGWGRVLPEALRARYVPEGSEALNALLRLERFDLAEIPWVTRRLPYLEAPVSGVARLAPGQVVGQLLAPGLRVLDRRLPSQVEFNGTLQELAARGTVGDSRLNVLYTRAGGARLAGLLTLEGFPLEVLAEAAVGESEVSASATGAARFDIPLSAPERSYLRLASERLRVGGAEGDVALRFEDGSLFVERAEFRGKGFWRAQGKLTPDVLDFTLEAEDADFTPLLSLAPPLAALGVGARGSLDLRASGSTSAPEVRLSSPALELQAAGTRYRLLDTTASLSGGAFGLSGELRGVSPVEGRLALSGSGQVSLRPFITSGLALRFAGAATVPTVGRITDLEGRIFPGETGWRLEGGGVLGEPFTVSGDLAPLDLTLQGEDLNVSARRLFVASSTTDVLLNLRAREGTFVVSGDVFADEARVSFSRREGAEETSEAGLDENPREARTEDPATDPATDSPEDLTDALDTDTLDVTTQPDLAARRAPNPALERVVFDEVNVRAPREVILRENFGNAELSLGLTLTGTAATPRLEGEARTLRGTIRFSGQDFTLTEAVAAFDPSQGAFPTLSLDALASFEKTRALGDLAGRYEFVEPPGPTFDVQLSIAGSFEEEAGGRSLELEPALTSSALVQEAGDSGPRPLTEPELVSLLTLGRLQLDDPLVGGNSLAGSVAESALDTAVDLLVLSELQNALGEALGVDLLEIRTSALSTVLDRQLEDPFGVSVRVGGYLSENLFASLQVGRFSDPEQDYALSNEFSLRYSLDPLEFNLSGGVNFLDRGTLQTVTDFSLALSYSITPLISLDAELDTSTGAEVRDTRFGFGVSFTW